MGKEVVADPTEGLEGDDATKVEDLDEGARKSEQQEFYGGDPLDDDGDESTDRGDNLGDEEEEDTDRGDEVDEESAEESEEESEGEEEEADDAKEDEAESDADEGDEGESAESDSEDETADDGDQDDSESDEEDEDEVEDPKPKGIPRKRFNEVNTRMKNAEAEIARLRAVDTAEDEGTKETFDFDTAEDEYMTLLLDGKTKEAGDKRREIRAAEKADFKAETVAEATASVSQIQTADTLDSLTREAEKMFPLFDANHEDHNPAAVSKTLTFMRGYQAEGMKDDDAFVAALADSIDLYNLATESGESESQSDEGQEEDDAPKKKVVTKKKGIKKVKEKIAASKRQAKSPVGEGKGSAEAGAVVPNIEQLSDEELDALPPDTLARMRGDML